MPDVDKPWQPTRIERLVEAFPTGSNVVRVETDQGEGFLKALSNKAEPHNLACELVGTLLARWLGLPTFEFALIPVTAEDEIRLADGSFAHPGPAFIARLEDGHPWGGKADELDQVDNPQDVARLVAFDTWTRNCDRYLPREGGARINRDNVYFSAHGATRGRFVLKAIDHGCCFTCGRELTPRLADLEAVGDPRLYGCFPEFRERVTRAGVLAVVGQVEAVQTEEVEAMIAKVPPAWDVRPEVREAWRTFILRRARFIRQIFEREWPRLDLFEDVPESEARP